MSIAFPLVVVPRREVTLGGVQVGRQTVLAELHTQSVADVRSYIRALTVQETTQQIRLNNPPQIMTVDGRTNKPLDDVNRTTVVLFGVALAVSAMREVEVALADAIARSSRARTGLLGNVSSSWQWVYIPKGKAPRVVSAGSAPKTFALGDQLVLSPQRVPYATITNRNVARGGRLNQPVRKRRAAKSQYNASKSLQNRGFLAVATAAVRAKPSFKQFSVSAVFSKKHMVPGELMTRTQGSGMIVIRARIRRMKV
jgi:hypothetical protein